MKKQFSTLIFLLIILQLSLLFHVCYASDYGSYYLIKLFDDFYDGRLEQRVLDDEHDEGELFQKWRAQFLVTHSLTNRYAFDRNSQEVSLATHIFGKNPLTLSEIFLPAYLADQEKIVEEIPDCTDCITIDDQYLPQLTDLELCFNASQITTKLNFSFLRTLISDSTRTNVIFGMNIPIIHQKHILDMQLSGGAFSSTEIVTDGTAVDLFFKQFNSTDDFMRSFVFDFCKNLCFKKIQSIWGLGDVALFAGFDFGRCLNEDSHMIFGTNVIVPTSDKKSSANVIWSPELANEGAWIINPFFNSTIHVNKIINFSWHIAGFFSPEFSTNRRIAKIEKLEEESLGSETDLCLPSNLTCYLIRPFSAYDSISPQFADHSFCVKINRGLGAMVRVGNTVQDLFDAISLQIGLFYSFSYKNGDSITVNEPENTEILPNVGQKKTDATENNVFDICALSESHRSIAHTVEWKASYQFNDHIGFSIGTLHVVGGENVIKRNEIVAKINGYF